MPLLLLLAACNIDVTTANGELGRLSYSLGTGYFVEGDDLTTLGIVTGHPQYFSVELSAKGHNDAGKEASEITHRISPSDGVDLEVESFGDEPPDRPPTFTVTVRDPGAYTIESELNGEEFDRVTLNFATPTSLQLITWAREPYGEDFVLVDDGATLSEGTQLAFLGIPLGDSGDRLVGDIETSFTADPASSVVPAENIYDVNETNTLNAESVPSLYFIEPGTIGVTLKDTVGPAEATASFEVTPI